MTTMPSVFSNGYIYLEKFQIVYNYLFVLYDAKLMLIFTPIFCAISRRNLGKNTQKKACKFYASLRVSQENR